MAPRCLNRTQGDQIPEKPGYATGGFESASSPTGGEDGMRCLMGPTCHRKKNGTRLSAEEGEEGEGAPAWLIGPVGELGRTRGEGGFGWGFLFFLFSSLFSKAFSKIFSKWSVDFN